VPCGDDALGKACTLGKCLAYYILYYEQLIFKSIYWYLITFQCILSISYLLENTLYVHLLPLLYNGAAKNNIKISKE